jgi:hypothetical protein
MHATHLLGIFALPTRLVLHDRGLHGDLHESCWVWLEEQGARRHRKCSAPQKEPGEVVDELLEETREQCDV